MEPSHFLLTELIKTQVVGVEDINFKGDNLTADTPGEAVEKTCMTLVIINSNTVCFIALYACNKYTNINKMVICLRQRKNYHRIISV